jgi:hypothetical protein
MKDVEWVGGSIYGGPCVEWVSGVQGENSTGGERRRGVWSG